MVEWMLAQPGMERVGSINPVVAETNDGGLNAFARVRFARSTCARRSTAPSGPVAEGSVGAGQGRRRSDGRAASARRRAWCRSRSAATRSACSCRRNFGGILQVLGAPVGKELGQYAVQERVDGRSRRRVVRDGRRDGRAAVGPQSRAARGAAIMGLARTGSSASNGSGDFVIAFSTATSVRRRQRRLHRDGGPLSAPDRGSDERRNVWPVRGGRRGDGGVDLQLAVHGDAGHGARSHGGCDSARPRARGAEEVQRRAVAHVIPSRRRGILIVPIESPLPPR